MIVFNAPVFNVYCKLAQKNTIRKKADAREVSVRMNTLPFLGNNDVNAVSSVCPPSLVAFAHPNMAIATTRTS